MTSEGEYNSLVFSTNLSDPITLSAFLFEHQWLSNRNGIYSYVSTWYLIRRIRIIKFFLLKERKKSKKYALTWAVLSHEEFLLWPIHEKSRLRSKQGAFSLYNLELAASIWEHAFIWKNLIYIQVWILSFKQKIEKESKIRFLK